MPITDANDPNGIGRPAKVFVMLMDIYHSSPAAFGGHERLPNNMLAIKHITRRKAVACPYANSHTKSSCLKDYRDSVVPCLPMITKSALGAGAFVATTNTGLPTASKAFVPGDTRMTGVPAGMTNVREPPL
jgi:hypothetical protein